MKTTKATYKISKRTGFKKPVIFFVAVVIATGCKEVYQPNIESPATGYLVVDGFINSDGGATTISLTRTTKLDDTISVVYEHKAQVDIESDNNESYPLIEQGSGQYVSAPLPLNSNEKYKVHIITANGKEYMSDFVAVQHTPPIDSITWKVENDGVQIYTNAHDDAGIAKYYRWKYSETWEFHSAFLKTLEYIFDPQTGLAIGVGQIQADTSIYKCWRSQNSSHIILGTTDKLSTAKIYLPIRYIQPQSDELSVLYYIDLKQYVLSKEAYSFYQKLKKNTEQLGTIFDAQPSEIQGNIHSVKDPGEIVVGYIDVSQEQEKKLFISHHELPIPWLPHILCEQTKMPIDPAYINISLMPTSVAEYEGLAIKSYYVADPICVDCTLRGTNVRPSFWP